MEDIKGNVFIISHHRSLYENISGTNKILSGCFTHKHMDILEDDEYEKIKQHADNGLPVIYILRDVRSVMTSLYRFYKEREIIHSLEKHEHFKYKSTFIKFMKGEYIDDSISAIVARQVFKNPPLSWVNHTQWLYEPWIYMIKFEDLKLNGIEIIENVEKKFGLFLNHSEIKLLNELVGVVPYKGTIDSWREILSDEEEQYIWEIAGEKMIELGYSRNSI
jgi:hypothetical protein